MLETDITHRLTELESKLAYQDDTIDTLNSVIIEQQKQIDGLVRVIQKFKGELQELQDSSGSPPQQEPPPPHY